jgi:hypothetical protein
MLAEPITWELLESGVDPLIAATVIANVLLPLAMLSLGIRVRRRTQRTESRADRSSK